MRLEIKKILEKLGVHKPLLAYETHPWFHYDEEKGITCSAEVRMGPGAQDAEAEIQFLYDEPEEHDKTNPEQIMLMRIKPVTEYLWSPHFLKIRGEDYVNKIGKWEEKACELFKSCIQSLQMGELPNIDELIEKEMADDSDGRGGRRGRIGRKSPKVKPQALMGIKKSM